jgi:uncharacterized membrane protein YccC
MLPENDLNSVQGQRAEGVSAPVVETPATQEGVTQNVTPIQQPTVDVEAIKAKYENDLNQLKSSLQRREAQVNADWQKRYGELQKQIHETRMSSMTDEERARYERQLESEEMQNLQNRLSELENEKQQLAAAVNAQSFFIQQGVPADKLNLSEGYDAVVSAGWGYLTGELAQLRAAKANPQPQAPIEPAPLKQAPGVVTDKGTPGSGTTWAALRATFGTDEAIYRAVEEGRLDPSIIPTS